MWTQQKQNRAAFFHHALLEQIYMHRAEQWRIRGERQQQHEKKDQRPDMGKWVLF